MHLHTLDVVPPADWDGVFALFHEVWGRESERPEYGPPVNARLNALRQGLENMRLEARLLRDEVTHQRRRVDRLQMAAIRVLEELRDDCTSELARVDRAAPHA